MNDLSNVSQPLPPKPASRKRARANDDGAEDLPTTKRVRSDADGADAPPAPKKRAPRKPNNKRTSALVPPKRSRKPTNKGASSSMPTTSKASAQNAEATEPSATPIAPQEPSKKRSRPDAEDEDATPAPKRTRKAPSRQTPARSKATTHSKATTRSKATSSTKSTSLPKTTSRAKKSSLRSSESKIGESPRKSVAFSLPEPENEHDCGALRGSARFHSPSTEGDNNEESLCDSLRISNLSNEEEDFATPKKSIYSDSDFDTDYSCMTEDGEEHDPPKWDLPAAVEDPVKAKFSPLLLVYLQSSDPEEKGVVHFSIRDLLTHSTRIQFLIQHQGPNTLAGTCLAVPAWTTMSTLFDYHWYIASQHRAHFSHEQPHWGQDPSRLLELHFLALWMQDADCADATLSCLIRSIRTSTTPLEITTDDAAEIFNRLDTLASFAPNSPADHITRCLAHAAPLRDLIADLLTSSDVVAAVRADIETSPHDYPASLLAVLQPRLPSPSTKTVRDDPAFLGPERDWCREYHIHTAVGLPCAVLAGLQKAGGKEMGEDRSTVREGWAEFKAEKARRKAEKLAVEEGARRVEEARRRQEERRKAWLEDLHFTDSEDDDSSESDDE